MLVERQGELAQSRGVTDRSGNLGIRKSKLLCSLKGKRLLSNTENYLEGQEGLNNSDLMWEKTGRTQRKSFRGKGRDRPGCLEELLRSLCLD